MGLLFNFDFRRRVPPPGLRRAIESLWFARGEVPYAEEQVAPTGSVVAVFVLGPPIEVRAGGALLWAERGFLVGPHDRPVVNRPTGETHAYGIVTTSVGCEAVFGVRPALLRGRVQSFEDAWPTGIELRDTLLGLQPDRGLQVLEQRLGAEVRLGVPALSRCERAVALLTADPVRPIADIAGELGVSHAHLCREFTRVVGQSPRSLARLLRLRKLQANLDVNQPVNWAELALRHGWYDQAHLIRDFGKHTGVTPTEYVKAQRQEFGEPAPGETAGFTPSR